MKQGARVPSNGNGGDILLRHTFCLSKMSLLLFLSFGRPQYENLHMSKVDWIHLFAMGSQ